MKIRTSKSTTIKHWLLAITVAIAFISCNTNPSQDKDTLKLGVMASMDYLPLAVAQREGYFEKLNLKIDLQKFYSANERDAAFQSKVIDGCVIDFTGAILQKVGGMNLKLTSKCDAPFYIVASKRNEINSMGDLKNKEIAISQNTVIDYIVDMALQKEGMTANDVKKVEVNKIPLRYELLRNNKIDATGLPNPFALLLAKDGYKVLTSNDSLGFAITGIIFHDETLNVKKEQIKKMYEAYNMGVDYLASHSIDDIKDILIKDFAFTEDIINLTTLPKYEHATLPQKEDLVRVAKWLKERKLIAPNFDTSTLMDDSVIQLDLVE